MKPVTSVPVRFSTTIVTATWSTLRRRLQFARRPAGIEGVSVDLPRGVGSVGGSIGVRVGATSGRRRRTRRADGIGVRVAGRQAVRVARIVGVGRRWAPDSRRAVRVGRQDRRARRPGVEAACGWGGRSDGVARRPRRQVAVGGGGVRGRSALRSGRGRGAWCRRRRQAIGVRVGRDVLVGRSVRVGLGCALRPRSAVGRGGVGTRGRVGRVRCARVSERQTVAIDDTARLGVAVCELGRDLERKVEIAIAEDLPLPVEGRGLAGQQLAQGARGGLQEDRRGAGIAGQQIRGRDVFSRLGRMFLIVTTMSRRAGVARHRAGAAHALQPVVSTRCGYAQQRRSHQPQDRTSHLRMPWIPPLRPWPCRPVPNLRPLRSEPASSESTDSPPSRRAPLRPFRPSRVPKTLSVVPLFDLSAYTEAFSLNRSAGSKSI